MVPRLWVDEPSSRFLPEDCCSNCKYYDRSYHSVHWVQEWSLHYICPVSIPAGIHRHRSHSLRSHIGLFVGANASHRRGKVDIRLPPGICLNKIVSSIPCWKMPCILCLVDSHVHSISRRGGRNLIVAVRSRDPSRGHTTLDLPVWSRSYREHIRFHGTWLLAGSVRHFCVKIRVGTAHLRLGSAHGVLGSTIPSYQSASSIFRYWKRTSLHRVYSSVSRGPPSRKRWLLLLLSRSEFHRRPHPSRPRASRLQVCRKEREKTGSARPQSSVMFLN